VTGVPTDRLDAAIDRLPRAELVAFVAALERARGATVARVAPGRLRVDRGGHERVLRVLAGGASGRTRRIVGRSLGGAVRTRVPTVERHDDDRVERGTDPPSDCDPRADVVVATGVLEVGRRGRTPDRDSDPEPGPGTPPIRRGTRDLRNRLLYAIDRDEAARLAVTHLDVDLTAGVDDARGRAGRTSSVDRAVPGGVAVRSPWLVGLALVVGAVVLAAATGAAIGPLADVTTDARTAPGAGDGQPDRASTEPGGPDRGADGTPTDGSTAGPGTDGKRTPPAGDSTLTVLHEVPDRTGRSGAGATPTRYPPGVTEAGAVDPAELAAAHRRAVRGGTHTVTFEGRGVPPATVAGPGAPAGAPTGNASGRWASAAGRVVAHNASAYRTSVAATWVPRRRAGQVSLDYEAFAAAGVEYRRETVGRGIGWVRYGNRTLSPSSTNRTARWTPTGWTAEWVDAGLSGTDLTVTPVATDGGRPRLLLAGTRTERAPWIGVYTVRVEAVVSPAGVVRRFAVSRRIGDDDPVVTRRFRVTDAPTDPTVPDWRTIPRDPWGGTTAANGTRRVVPSHVPTGGPRAPGP
jgi:hypothetical protein